MERPRSVCRYPWYQYRTSCSGGAESCLAVTAQRWNKYTPTGVGQQCCCDIGAVRFKTMHGYYCSS